MGWMSASSACSRLPVTDRLTERSTETTPRKRRLRSTTYHELPLSSLSWRMIAGPSGGVFLMRGLLCGWPTSGAEDVGEIHPAKEGAHIVVGGLVQDLVRGAHLHQPAILHDGDAIADTHASSRSWEIKMMVRCWLACSFEQPRPYLELLDQDPAPKRPRPSAGYRVIGERPGQADPLLHAAGEASGEGVNPLTQSHLIERLTGTLLALRQGRHPGQLQTEGGILQHAQVWHQGRRTGTPC